LQGEQDTWKLYPAWKAAQRQDGETGTLLTRPALMRRDASFTKRRSRIARTFNVPNCVRFMPSLAAALLNNRFDHPGDELMVGLEH